jgi:stress response protein YsnF
MAKVVTALYDSFDTAQKTVDALISAGFARERISMVANDASRTYSAHLEGYETTPDDVKGGEGARFGAIAGALIGLGALLIPGIGPVVAGGPLIAALVGGGVGAVAGGVTGGITASLVKLGVDEDNAEFYAEGIKRGGAFVAVETSDEQADEAVDVLENYNPADINTRISEWRETGWTGFNPDVPYTPSTTTNDEVRVPVIEEELKVGKREANNGNRVHVHTYVTETPVQEQVTLREEHVSVERTPVNRPANAADFGQEADYEFTERSEEAVVEKQARVVEEVVVRKDVNERTETVSDTVRRQDVEIDKKPN